ncbi:DUF4367 domain-containing protein [Ruminococcus sp. OA3]|uniref:DUF4367 domain-containing protein n=1 Tax=Ruminococcus sp. OA3 TaxID=2914164 RepID=UPI001F071099|nr:DUF4367 domain-containing protein [Ruminococcus sp. OA3]MCH1981825.1 DUF4367 domain-containing protein [Ruminococcus sp. OA3]
MKDVNIEKVLKNLGEEAILEQWEKDTPGHNFSLNYKKKKLQLLQNTQQGNKKTTIKKKRLLAAACVAAVLSLSAGVYAAVSVFSTKVTFDEEQGQASLSFETLANSDIPPIEITPEYLPAGYQEWEEGKYSEGGEYAADGITIIQANYASYVALGDTSDLEETTLGGVKAVIAVTEGAAYPYDVFLLYEDTGHIVEIMACDKLSLEEVKEVAANIVITEVEGSGQNATAAFSAESDDMIEEAEEDPVAAEQICQAGDTFADGFAAFEERDLQYTVENVTVSDTVPLDRVTQETTGSTQEDYDRVMSFLDEDGTLKPFTRTVTLWEDNRLVTREMETVLVKYVEVTVKAENLSSEAAEDIGQYNTLRHLYEQEDGTFKEAYLGSRYADMEGYRSEETYGITYDSRQFLFDGSSYLDDPKHYFFTDFAPGEVRELHFGYAVPEDELDDLYMLFSGDSGDETYVRLDVQP